MRQFFAVIFVLIPSSVFPQKGNQKITSISYFGKTVTVYTSADSTDLRLSETDKIVFMKLPQPTEGEVSIFVDPGKTFQTFIGIGAALTDASTETFAKLPIEKQPEFLQAYFNKDKGIGYTLARTNIHSCDFSSDSYTYVSKGDSLLNTFSINHDKQFRIPFIKQAIAATGGKLTLYASPWSPPSFMKTNNEMLHGGKLNPAFNLSKKKMKAGEQIEESVTITNIGKYDGEKIVQLYLGDKVGSIARPVKELKDLKKIKLSAGESVTIRFIIDKEKLFFYNQQLQWVAEPGDFELMIGASSKDIRLKDNFELIK